ncbi:MAG TPA: chorismate synthase [Thermoleophilia bacterium]|nr:chorismate synthase [Thermoleophilia bacterium]
MTHLRYLTAGESHGRQLTAILEGCPAGLAVSRERIDRELARRQHGYGRGDRQSIERDSVDIVGGIRYGRTTGAPVALVVANRDASNWGHVLSVDEQVEEARAEPVLIPRPGHADLGGVLLYERDDIRDVIERASARETAARVACGVVARLLLEALGCLVASHVVSIGAVRSDAALTLETVADVERDPCRCGDSAAGVRMVKAIDAAREAGDTLGGVIEVIAFGYPPGVGTYVQGDRRLSSTLAAAVMSVPAMKGVEVGLGFAAAGLPGSQVQDPLGHADDKGYVRASNHAGGVEGGISTGEQIVIRAAMKPIATLANPLASVQLGTHEPVASRYERADVCAVPAAGIVLEAVVALALADAALDRFGGATVADVIGAVDAYRARTRLR